MLDARHHELSDAHPAVHDEALGAEIEGMKKGTLDGTYKGPYREEMEKRVEVDFAWKLLAGDLIEEQGTIPQAELSAANGKEGSLRALARRLAGIVSLPLTFVESKLRKLSARRLILCQKSPDSFHWFWRED